jgi:hypothetical protein
MDTSPTNIHLWSLVSVPQLAGKTIVIIGANSGIGFQCARIFASAGTIGWTLSRLDPVAVIERR